MAELRPYEPSWRDRLAMMMMGDGRASPERRRVVEGLLGSTGLGNTGVGAADFTPAGLLFAGNEYQRAKEEGDRMGAALAAIGMVPGAGPVAREVAPVARRVAAEVAENPRAVIGGNMPPPEAAVPVERTARAPVTPEGYAVKGKDFSRAQQETLREMANEPKGVGPLDLTAPQMTQTPQASIVRTVPARGVSPRLQRALENPEVERGIRESVMRGIEMGADKWYHTEPIRQAFIRELGEEAGAERFKRFMDYTAATSPRSDVSTNIRNASFYYMKDGQPIAKEDLVYPYGHVAQNLHLQNAATIQGGGFDVFRNPKPASFAENLQGNLAPVTVDTHAFRNIAMRTRDPEFLETSISVQNKTGKAAANLDDDEKALLTMAQRYGEFSEDGKKIVFRPQKLFAEGRLTMDEALKIPSFWASKPRDNEYGAAEKLYIKIADELGIPPADVQAAAWAGAGDLTGLASPPTKTFPQLFNERVEYTARMRGEDPRDTLQMMIRAQKPLLGLGAGALGVGGLLSEDPNGGVY